jgi:hypothetical protein
MNTEHEHTINGVAGRMFSRHVRSAEAGTWAAQMWKASREYLEGKDRLRLTVCIRFDDQCGNGHNSFSITGDICIWERGRWHEYAGGCVHDEIAQVFPELAPLIKWHLGNTTGPMHYPANVAYLAGDRDCWGTRAGEVRRYATRIRFKDNPILHAPGGHNSDKFVAFLEQHAPQFDLEVLRYDHDDRSKTGKYQFEPKYTFGAFGSKWHECPFDTEDEALRFLAALQTCAPEFVKVPVAWGEGKARDLDAARSCAVWPEATDAELSQDKPALEAALMARLPALIAAFRADMEAAGFAWVAA